MHNPCPKPKTYDNEKYLKFIRGRPCGIPWCGNKSQAHHVRKIRWGAGVGQKPHDYVTISRCRELHHNPKFDDSGEQGSAVMEIIDNLMEWIEMEK